LIVLALALLLLVTGCSLRGSTGQDREGAERAAAELAAALARGDVSNVAFSGTTATAAESSRSTLLRGMGPVRPEVSVTRMEVQRRTATAGLRYTWTFAGVPTSWTYETTAGLRKEGDRWLATWTPTVVHPELSDASRLSQRRRYPPRGRLLGEDGDPLVVERAVVRYGIDKSSVSAEQAVASARRLADLLAMDEDGYVRKVRQAGPEAFVEALVLRATAPERPRRQDVAAIDGALGIEGTQMLAPTRDFARPVIGTVGEATKEIVDASGGRIVTGDQVGLSGLQRRYDDRLRGIPGVQVDLLVPPPPSPSPGPSASPLATPSPGASPTPVQRRRLFEVDAVLGTDLTITLNGFLQERAEAILADVESSSALVAIRPSTGGVLVAANGPGTKGQSVATVGQAPPGSTFKIVTSLALLRAGLTPDSSVSCPPRITVDGRRFGNYSDYPSDALGQITLRTAVAQSCNTAFIGERSRLAGDALATAAGSLGLGVDYDVGFASYFGQVPEGPTGTALAAAAIGQGTVLASPLAMAGVVASVQAGHTVIPHLVEGERAEPNTTPLTREEAGHLRSLLRSVVTSGSGRLLADLRGPAVMAKTGTAEYGRRPPYPTHAWMVAAQGDLAVAVFVRDGESGSRTAGPLIKEFLRVAG
jgi:cell division protein FtsI/penicillin-binding protein 2